MKVIRFIDMDGVLAQWGTVGYTEKGYFRNRPIIVNMVNAVKQMVEAGEIVYILSAVLQNGYAADEKHLWLDEIFGDLIPRERRIFVPYGESKADYVKQFDGILVLIDDFNDNLFSWDGISIKFLNGVNGGSNEWTGHAINYMWSPTMICNHINAICNAALLQKGCA